MSSSPVSLDSWSARSWAVIAGAARAMVSVSSCVSDPCGAMTISRPSSSPRSRSGTQ
ncbi:hypothetical protein [Streptomyces sp. NPDC052721]|uniref:hypothetical protein n=1 Tax=Streptomyces sp. NPDC052721 TaxID=3154955 RepID=UPI0034348059